MVLYFLVKHMICFLNEKKKEIYPQLLLGEINWYLQETSEAVSSYCHSTII